MKKFKYLIVVLVAILLAGGCSFNEEESNNKQYSDNGFSITLPSDFYKKDLARIAMCYPHVYVACVNIGYNKEQYLKALQEANNHKGPSIIIAYAPCIEHGIKTGMEHSLDDGYLASKCGYFLTFRYNPDTGVFNLDSKDIDLDKYDLFLLEFFP